VLCHFSQEVQGAEDLEVTLRSASQVPARWAGKAAAVVLLRSINHLTVFGQPHHASKAQRTAEDVLGQPLQSCGGSKGVRPDPFDFPRRVSRRRPQPASRRGNAVFADGHVIFVGDTIESVVWQRLAAIADGHVIPADF